MKDTQSSTKIRKGKPRRSDGGTDFRNVSDGEHVPKNTYKRKSKHQLQDDILEELDDDEET
jgi:hypothetical protein